MPSQSFNFLTQIETKLECIKFFFEQYHLSRFNINDTDTYLKWKQYWFKSIASSPNPEKVIISLKSFFTKVTDESTSQFNLSDSLIDFISKIFFNKIFFLRLITLFSNSPVLSQFFLKDPELFRDDLFAKKESVKEFRKTKQEWLKHIIERGLVVSNTVNTSNSKYSNPTATRSGDNKTTEIKILRDKIFTEIRKQKLKDYIRISLADYLGVDDFEETVEKISVVAEMAVEYALYYTGLNNLPIGVMAMGKLGGNELNYNSDIDLMFVAGNDLSIHRNYKNNVDVIERIQQFIAILNEYTVDGFVYKVDLRIRPEGNQGQLYLTLNQYYQYYQKRAQTWEFQALIKARQVGGDWNIGKQFEEFRDKWVFNPDFSSKKMLLSIARIKANIEHFHKPHEYRDLKLAPGGIRDLEFIVQFLQIHHGKITQVLSYTNTLITLDQLLTYKIITIRQHKSFRSNYCFLRRIEHYLQLIELLPVQRIPTDEKHLIVIAKMMGHETTEELVKKIKEVMNFNQDLFVRIFKITTSFYEKFDEIRTELLASSNTTEYWYYFSKHITHLESDYFLNFSTKKIIEHIKLLRKLVINKTKLEIEFSKSTINQKSSNCSIVNIELFANDYKVIFSLICGLVSIHGISILKGASFLYQKKQELNKYFSSSNIIKINGMNQLATGEDHSSITKTKQSAIDQALVKKKFIFSMQGVFINRLAEEEFNKEQLYEQINEAINEMDFNLSEKTMEKILLRSISSINRFGLDSNQDQLRPIHLNIDNTSHLLYTIIDIKSEDSFLFLFFFTYALSFKGYYIIKVEFSTPKNQILNRIFLTDNQKRKIHDEDKLTELKSSILMIKYFSSFMKDAPNPSLAYKTFNQLIGSMAVSQYSEDDHTDFNLLFQDLVKVLGTGEVIMEDFLRIQHNDIRAFLRDKKTISEKLTIPWLNQQLDLFFAKNNTDPPAKNLNKFKDQFLFHLDLKMLTASITFGEFCKEMSNLTDVVMIKTIEIALEQTLEKFRIKKEPGRHALVALGKWGSQEMGYASDIELVFIYDQNKTKRKDKIKHDSSDTIKDFYVFMGNLIPSIIESKKNGVFEVDLRLRPESESSNIATSLNKFSHYYGPNGRYLNYEKMVLTRLRVVDGDNKLKEEIRNIRDSFVYEMDNFDLNDYRLLREKQIVHLTNTVALSSTRTSFQPSKHSKQDDLFINRTINVKFSSGGLVDIEYLLQILAIKYGKKYLEVRQNSIVKIAEALTNIKIINQKDFDNIINCYKFLRNLINCLRIMRGNAKDMVLPERDSLEMEYLKRTMVNFQVISKQTILYDSIKDIMEKVVVLRRKYLY